MPTNLQINEINQPIWDGWMTRGQILLFKTALGEADKAISAWEKWNTLINFDLEHLDPLSYYILPHVYKNLSEHDYIDKNTSKLKGIYRKGWVEKQLITQRFNELTREMEIQSIKYILLNDQASIANLYSGDGIRLPFSSDFWIHPDHISRCLEIFRSLKIKPIINRPLRYLSVETSLPLWSNNHGMYTITWRPIPGIVTREDAIAFFDDGSNFLHTKPGATLSLELHFIMACMQFSRSTPQAAFNAIIDVAYLMKKYKEKIDWDIVGYHTERFQLNLIIQDSFRFLVDVLASDLQEINKRFKQIRISPVRRLEHKILKSKKRGGFVQIAKRLARYVQAPKNHGWLSFPRYIQYTWGANGLIEIPIKALERFENLMWKKEAN